MSGPVRWGLIGGGWLGRAFAAPAIRASRGGELVAVCDPSEEARRAVAAPWSGESAEQLLDRPEVEAVYIATPNHLHAGAAIAAARAGKHVLCEKPMALCADDAQRIVEACRGAGVQ